MRTASLLLSFGVLSFGAVALGGCHADHRYVSPPGGSTWQVALDPATPPIFSGEELTVFAVETRIELPIRAPSEADMNGLLSVQPAPFPRAPWVRRGEYELELDVTLTNLNTDPDSGPLQITVTINGFNEFHEYSPQVSLVGDDPVVDFSGWEEAFLLEPGARRTFTVREESFDEVAVDLATVVNDAMVNPTPNSNLIVYFQNHSAHDERSQQWIPSVIPALTGFRLGLRVEAGEGATMPPPAALEAVLRARDPSDRLVAYGETPWQLPVPTLFMPVGAMMP